MSDQDEQTKPQSVHDADMAEGLMALEAELLRQEQSAISSTDATALDMLQWALAAPSEARGRAVGPYVLREFRGAGAYGSVWKAVDQRTGDLVALKVPHLNWRSEQDLTERYEREVVALRGFHHPNVLPVNEIVRDEGWLAMVMPYCDGPTLEAWLDAQSQATDQRIAVWIVKVLADALQSCHEHGVVHGDIKPGNILLFRSRGVDGFPYEPRLADFGLAVLAGDSQRLRGSSTLGGTLEYMAPELFRDGTSSRQPSSDLYALGVLLHVLLLGRAPFTGRSVGEVIARILDQPPGPMVANGIAVPEGLERILRKCLAKEPSARYRSCADLEEDLQAFLDHRRITARAESLAVEWSRRLRRRERVVEAGVLTLSIQSTLLIWMVIATAMAALGVPWLPAHMTVTRMVRDTIQMGGLTLLTMGFVVGFMRGTAWCALVSGGINLGLAGMSLGNLVGWIEPPFDGVYAADLKLQVVVFSLLTVLFAIQAITNVAAWWILRKSAAGPLPPSRP